MLFNRKAQAPTPPPEPEKVEPPPADPPETPPQYASKEDLTNLQASIYQLQDNVTNFFMQQNKPVTPAAPVTPQIEDVSDEEYEKAIMGELDRRTAAQVVQKRATAIAKRENLALQQELNQLKSVGMGAISNLTAQGLTSKPYYKDYKKEIDAAIAQLDPASRVNAEALNGVYNYIIGGHMDEILAKEREATLRQAAPKPEATLPNSRSSFAATTNPDIPSPEDVLDPAAIAQIHQWFGKGPAAIDRFVKGQRCNSWEDYYNRYLKPLNETEGNA